MLRNASLFEILWSFMAAIGLCFYIMLGWLAYGDRRHLKQPTNGATDRRSLTSRQIIATMNISVSLLLGGIDVSLLFGGVISMYLPAVNQSTSRNLTVTAVVLLLSLFAVHVFLIAVALVLFVARTRLLAKLEADREVLASLQGARS